MSHSTTARLRHQIFRLNQGEQADLDFGLGEILPPEDLTLILTEEGATWKSIIYTPLLTTWAFLWQMLSPDRSCRAAVKRIAAWLSSQGKKLANDEDDPYIKAEFRCQRRNSGVRASFRVADDHDGAAHGRCRGDGK